MRRLILNVAPLALLLAFFVPSARAQQDETERKIKMPCSQVLKLGLNKFINVYGEESGDYSNYGQKQAFGYYVDCKRPENDALARKLSEERRRQVNEAREALMKVGNAGWTMRYISEGGGTMWSLASVGAYAEREDYMETIIRALTLPERKQPTLRRRADLSLRKAQALLARYSRTPKLEYTAPESKASERKSYQEAVREARSGLVRLQSLITVLPDAAAERLARRTANELNAAFTN